VGKIESDVTVDRSQQMVFGNLVFDLEVIEQLLRAGVVRRHEQQASEQCDQQHRELRPAYNLIVTLVQA